MIAKKIAKVAASLVATTCLTGCGPPDPLSVEMDLSAVNTANRILVVEGNTTLPPGSRLQAELQSRDGKTIMRDRSNVRDGAFFFDFDLDRLSEFSSYRLVVLFDPKKAPLGVRHRIGLWGEALEGPGVQKLTDRKVFLTHKEILLSASAGGRDWEGRDFEEMDPSERSELTEQLERFVEEKPQDKVAKLALAKAYLAAEPGEYSEGSRAHKLLVEAARTPETDPNGRIAKKLLAEVEGHEAEKQAKLRKQKAVSSGAKYRKDYSVEPGVSLGAFRLGLPYKVVSRYFKLDRRADFKNSDKHQKVLLTDFHNLELTFGSRSKKLLRIRTTSPKFKLKEGFGVGSSLAELRERYGEDIIPKPKWSYVTIDSRGYKIYKANIRTKGLRLEVGREVDPSGAAYENVTGMVILRSKSPAADDNGDSKSEQ